MYSLFGKKIIFSILLLGFGNLVFSQSNSTDNYNYRDFQKKGYYFGLSLGLNNSGYVVNQSKLFIGNESIKVTEGSSGYNFNLNMIANIKLGDYFDFRFLPGFAFTERNLEFTDVETSIVNSEKSDAVFFELPFLVRFKSEPYKDKRVFVLGGLKYGYDVASNSNSKKSILKYSPHDFQWEVGIGMQFFYPYFIFSPEIKYSRGFTNKLIYDNSLNEARVLENIFSQAFTLSFNFEG